MRPDLRRRRLYRGVGRFISIAVAIGMSVWRAREAKNVETYGSARWAERKIRAAGLLGPDGVVLGRSTATISAMTVRSMSVLRTDAIGQGRRPGRADAADLAGLAIVRHQGRELDADRRLPARHGRVLLFDPTNPASAAYNPLLEVRRGEWKSATCRTSPTSWSIPKARSRSGTIGKRPAMRCWSARSCMSSMPSPTRRWPASPPSCPIKAPDRVDAARDDEDAPSRRSRRASVVASAARELLNKSDNERSGVLSTAMSFLGLYRDPVVAR
jgi:type IV secretion system protein VirD4